MKIRYHGNGFIQVPLNTVTRMHIYHPEAVERFGRVENARIHDHAFYFNSRVLLGALNHNTYSVREDEKEGHGLWEVDKSQEGEPLVRIGRCDLIQKVVTTIPAGGAYDFGGPDNFHDTFSKEPTITIMTRTDVVPHYCPKIVGLYDPTTVDDAFSGQPLKSELERYVEWAFMQLAIVV